MAAATTVVACPFRFYLLADNNKFVARSESQNTSYNKYYAQCRGDSADAPETVFEVLSTSPESKDMVTLKHVQSGQVLIQTKVVWILPDQLPWDTYFRLEAVDVKNNKAAIYVTIRDGNNSAEGLPQNAYLVRQNGNDGGGKILPEALIPTARTISEATIFTVHDSALKKVWKEVVYDFEKATMEDVKAFETGSDVMDNSDFDQIVTFHPALSYSRAIQSNWSSSSSFGFTESISVTAEVPFVTSVEVGFTAEQSFETQKGGEYQITTQRSVVLDVPVPPHSKVRVFVVGITGKVSIPFQHKEVAEYSDGSVRERILYDGVCRSVSSTGTNWKTKYVDDKGGPVSSFLGKKGPVSSLVGNKGGPVSSLLGTVSSLLGEDEEVLQWGELPKL